MLTPQPYQPVKGHQLAVLVFAVFVALLVIASAFLNNHDTDLDELGLYNPSYMVARYGTLTYPVHGYFDEPVIVHPPIHVGEIGLLLRAGLPWYYAEAMPAALFFLLAIVLAARLSVAATVRLSLLFGIGFMALGGVFLQHATAPWGLLFGTRPEGEVYAAWMCGLLLMESGRLRQWNLTSLFFGAFLMAWAAGVHYYAWSSMAGVLVYATLAVLDLRWKPALSKVGALIGGACMFGVPYLAFYVLPHLAEIRAAASNQAGAGGGIAGSLRMHQQWYRMCVTIPEVIAPLRSAFQLGIPLFILSTAVMLVVRSTRALALGALPLMLAVYLLNPHKQVAYLVHEISFFLTAGCLVALAAGNWLFKLGRIPAVQKTFPAIGAIFLGGYLLATNDVVQGAVAAVQPGVHEGEVARAAAREMLGTTAKVTGRIGMWYVAGAADWHNAQWDILAFPDSYDEVRYFSNFDAAVDHMHSSAQTMNGGSTLSAMYARGTLKLRAFFFGETNPELQYVLLNLERPRQVVGYAMKGGRLYHFEEQAGGDQELTVSVCTSPPWDSYRQLRKAATTFAFLALPDQPPYGPAFIFHVLAPRGAPPPLGWLRSCNAVKTIPGTLTPADKSAMVAALRREDLLIHFAYGLEDLPGYHEIGVPAKLAPPPDSIRLDHVLEPSRLMADNKRPMDQPGQFLVTTPSGIGSSAAHIPVAHGDAVDLPCGVELRLRVISGRIGFAITNRNPAQNKLASAYLGKTKQPVEVAVSVPTLKDANLVTIFNANLGRTSEVEILGATVLVSREVWGRNQAALAAVR